MLDPSQVPVFRVMQIGEAAVDQRTHEVHGQRRMRVSLDHPLRIGPACGGGEFRAIDQVTAETGQAHSVTNLQIGRARLRILAGKTAHPQHRLLQPVHQHQAHLQQHFQPVGDDWAGAIREAFRAVATLQQETPAFLRLGQRLLQREHFPRRHQRGQPRQLGTGRRQLERIVILRLL